MFVTEALHPYNVFVKAGFDVDLVSETGTYQADWLSQQEDWLAGDDRKAWEDRQSGFRQKLDAHLKPSDIDPSKVWCFTSTLACHVVTGLTFGNPVWRFLCICRARLIDRLP